MLTVTYGTAPVAVDDAQANTGVPSPTNPTTLALIGANDSDADGTIDAATVDLDPTTAGIDSTFYECRRYLCRGCFWKCNVYT